MKRVIYLMVGLVMTAWMLVGCASTEELASRAAEKKRKVLAALDAQDYKIEVQMMYPPRGIARNVTYGYSLEVRNDSLISYLPYFGRAYDVPYGGGKGLNFSARITSYQEYAGKKGQHKIEIGTENEEDKYLYYVEVFENGNATIDVMAQKRERISYSGVMSIPPSR